MKWGLPILWSIPLELGVSEVMVWAESKFSSKLFWSLLLGNQWWNGIQPIDIGNKKGIWAAEVRISPAIGIFMWHPGTPNRHHSHFWSSWGRLFNSSHSCRIFEIFACRQCEVTSGKSNFSLAESRDDSTSSFFLTFSRAQWDGWNSQTCVYNELGSWRLSTMIGLVKGKIYGWHLHILWRKTHGYPVDFPVNQPIEP